jgi:hypothetical protein
VETVDVLGHHDRVVHEEADRDIRRVYEVYPLVCPC